MIQTDISNGPKSQNPADRRIAPRHDIEPIGLVTLRAENPGSEYICTIRNLSVGGMMVEFCCISPDVLEKETAVGQCLTVVRIDEELKELLGGRSMTVVWQKGERSGMSFAEPLPMNSDELFQWLEEQRLLLWEEWRP